MTTALAHIEHALNPMRAQFDQLLRPTGVPAERIIRSVLVSCERTPKLLECTPVSIIQAATTGAVLGLEADGVTGQGFLVPFRDNKRNVMLAQWITGYKGQVTLGARVGLTIDGEVIREGDSFDFELGSQPFVKHKKALGTGMNRRIIGAWATATAPGRTPIVVVLDVDEINAVKARSQGAKARGGDAEFSPWNDPAVGYPAMASKTARRRLARSLPLSVYLSAARVDEAHEEQGKHAFIHPEHGVIIDGTVQPLAEEQPQGPPTHLLDRPPSFPIRRLDGTVYTAATIEEWRSKMTLAAAMISNRDNLEWFRDAHAEAMDDYSHDGHGNHVAAVAATIEKRLQEI